MYAIYQALSIMDPYRTRVVQSALFCAIGHFAQMNSAKTVCATLVHTIPLHDALLQTGCTIGPDEQIYGMHNQIRCTNQRGAQSDRMHKSTGCTTRAGCTFTQDTYIENKHIRTETL